MDDMLELLEEKKKHYAFIERMIELLKAMREMSVVKAATPIEDWIIRITDEKNKKGMEIVRLAREIRHHEEEMERESKNWM